MIRNVGRRVFYSTAPGWMILWRMRRYLRKQGAELLRLSAHSQTLDSDIDLLWNFPDFRPLQKKSEIRELVETMRAMTPQTILEIGSAGGGTTYLFIRNAPSDAVLVSLDLAFDETRKNIIEAFASGKQQVRCLSADSHSAETMHAVRDQLGSRPIDFLFIDGDHSYDGVKSDFEMFSPLVRPGGLIVFHDVVLDFRTRYGVQTSSDVGGVPRFWDEIKTSYNDCKEVIESPEQDGYGIGVLCWPGSTQSATSRLKEMRSSSS